MGETYRLSIGKVRIVDEGFKIAPAELSVCWIDVCLSGAKFRI